MKRIFIGIKIEADRNFRNLISGVKKELSGEAIKWTDLSNIHITLAFLGDTPEEKLEVLNGMLKQKCENKGRFEITLKGLGLFKSISEPKVFWAGIYQSDHLNTLQSDITAGLIVHGFPTEDRPFSPHLTIGRIKHISDKDKLKIILLKHHSTDIQRVPVTEVIVYESVLRQEGPLYKPLSVIKL